MTTTTKARPTKARTTAPKKAAPRKAAPKRTAAPKAAPTAPPPVDETPAATTTSGGNPMIDAYTKSMGFMESTVTGVMSLPLSVVSTLGVPREATDAAKGTQEAMTKGFSGAFTGVVSGVAGLAGKAPGVLGGMMSSATKLLP